jgi:outer membrane receptor for ferrienterochelin and colicin
MKRAKALASSLVLGIVLLSPGIGPVFAGTTGKITGVVNDQATQSPLIGANVMLEGMSFGAVTETDGSFTIMNCPPGIYTMKFTMMGYKKTFIRNVRVSADLTTAVDANLESTVIEGETVNIVSERPLIQKDMTGSMATIGADEISNLPVDNIQGVLRLQAGVSDAGGQIHIRGGRGGEVAYWVDGVPMTTARGGSGATRGMGINVENSAVQELQVVSGTFNAEYGNAMSGIVNIITKDGQEKYTGNISGYVQDYVSNDPMFGNLKRVDVVEDPATGQKDAVGVYENPNWDKFKSLSHYKPANYDLQPVLSGPVPYTRNKLTFFVNGRFHSYEGWEHGRRWYTPLGWPGDSAQVVLNENKTNSVMGKLSYRLSPHITLKYQMLFDNYKGSGVDRQFTYSPDARNHGKSERWTHMFLMNHVLSPKTFYELKLARYVGTGENNMLDNPFASVGYLASVAEDTSQDLPAEIFDYIKYPEKLHDADSLRRQVTYITNPESPYGWVHSDSAGAPVAYSFNRGGYPYLPNTNNQWMFTKGHEYYWLGKLDLTSQVTKIHQVKAGVEAKLTDLFTDQYSIIPLTIRNDSTGNIETVRPFMPSIPGDSTINRNTYTRKPKQFSVYVQDKIELKDLIVNIGVRYDYFDANSYIPVDYQDPNVYFPMKPVHKYADYVAPPESYGPAEREEWMKQFRPYTLDERRALMQKKAKASYAISPRLGFSYPITDRGIIHFCYGHFFAMPDLNLLYQSPDFKFSEAGGLTAFGNPALKPERTVQYEIGLQQQLSQNVGVDVTLFYRDIRDWTGAGPRITTVLPGITYSMMENKDYANVRGVTVSMTKRQSNHVSVNAAYTFQYAEGTYTNPLDAFTALQNNQARRIALIPMNYDTRHTLNANVNFNYGSWSVTLLGTYRTGNPYTPTFRTSESVGGTSAGSIPDNSEYTPDVKNVDMYIDKTFSVGGLRLGLFAKIYNVFDIRNEYGVYTDTGSAQYTTTPVPSSVPYDAKRIGTPEEQIKNPYNFSGPRQIQVGMTLGF